MKINNYLIFLIAITLTFQIACKKDKNSDGDNNLMIENTVIDIDGNVYHTVKIGNQTWMVENLKVTHLRGGMALMKLEPNDSSINPIYNYCAYERNDSFVNKYGYLYTHNVVYHSANGNPLPPKGWHIPTIFEWDTLITFLGGSGVAGGKLKESGFLNWNSPNSDATNESGFTALPGGALNSANVFHGMGDSCFFWSSTSCNGIAHQYVLSLANGSISEYGNYSGKAMPIRCIKDL